MPDPTPRPSLNTGLVGKYETERVGGAFDAKQIEKVDQNALLLNKYTKEHVGGAFDAKEITPVDQTALLLGKYEKEHAGGAFDAKNIVTDGGNQPFEKLSLQDSQWTKPGFKTRMTTTEFTNPEGSVFLQGHSTKKYTQGKLR